ncbi:MAG: hypothetical protein K2P94_13435 [Rhodospirillaceae bacterium]|nr:hypothetical protein [Rhodospirillaceae bacterium]
MRAGVLLGAVLLSGFAGAAEPAKPPPRTYPLAAKSLVLAAAVAGDSLVTVGDRGFILSSSDNGQTWKQHSSPVEVMLTGLHMSSATHGWAVGHDAVILNTTDGGVTWTEKFKDADLQTPLFDIWFENAMRGIAVGAYGLILETGDGGATWAERRISEDEPHLYTITPLNGAVYAVGELGSVFKSTDAGANWTALESPYAGTFFGGLALKDGGLLVYGLRGNLFRSDDGGGSWTALKTDTEASLLGATQRADGSVVVVGLSGTILTSADGRTFTRTTLADREALGGAVETASGKLLLLGEKGAHPWEAPR